MTGPAEPTEDEEPVWEFVSISGGFSAASGDDDDGAAGVREPLDPTDVPPELAAEAER